MDYQELKRNKLPRNKYGYVNNSNVTTRTKFSSIGVGTASEGYNGTDSVSIVLSKSTAVYSAGTTYASVNHDTTYITATSGSRQINTYVGEITGYIPNALNVSKWNDGTTYTYLTIDTTTNLYQDGMLSIPVYTNDLTQNPDQDATYLYYSWSLAKRGTSTYTLSLTNDSAMVNCDESGTILPGIEMPTCTAKLKYGDEDVADARYSISTPSQGVTGLSINDTTGVMTFASNFSFTGKSLAITVTVKINGNTITTKTMNVTKAFPGAEGESAVSYWLKLNATESIVNPNETSPTADPANITAQAYKQVGSESPVIASDATIYYGFNTVSPSTVYSAAVPVDITKKYITFVLKDSNGTTRDTQTVSIIKHGTDGEAGLSSYRLDLNNQNCGINADSNGNILPGAVRPQSTATLYYGTSVVSSAVYSLVLPSGTTGVTINASTGVITFANDSTLAFTGTTTAITVNATVNGVVCGTAILNLSKNFAGAPGAAGDSVIIEYSVDGSTNWHSTFTQGDKYMREKVGASGTWSAAIKIVGEDGADGENGEWTSFVFKSAKTKPAAPTGTAYIPEGWSDAPEVINYDDMRISAYSGDWGVNGNVFTSNEIDDYERTVERIYFTTTKANSVYKIELNVSSEPNYDYGFVGKLDTTLPYTGEVSSSYYILKACGYWGGEEEEDVMPTIETAYMTVANIGNHYIDLMYKKDGSQAYGRDNAIVTIHEVPNIWMSKAKVQDNVVVGNWSSPVKINGNDGAAPVTYWLELSCDKITVDVNDGYTCTPGTITASAKQQIGDNAPIAASDTVISYSFIYRSTGEEEWWSEYTGPLTVTPQMARDYSTIRFYLTNNNEQDVDSEDVPLLKEGLDGEPGATGPQGLKGASPRGPVKWEEQTVVRRFCNGTYNAQYADDQLWIDIIIKDGNYYYCKTSYNGSCNDEWSTVSQYWQIADQQFKFIATNILLAQNAFIDCLGSRGIHLLNDAGDSVVAGAVGGTGVNFFAGSSTPGSAPFRVNYDGTMTANKGTFGTLNIKKDVYYDEEEGVEKEYGLLESTNKIIHTDYKTILTPHNSQFIGYLHNAPEGAPEYYGEYTGDRFEIHPSPEPDINDNSSVIEINMDFYAWNLDKILRKAPSSWDSSDRSMLINEFGSYDNAVAAQKRYTLYSEDEQKYITRYTWRNAIETTGCINAADFTRTNWNTMKDERAVTTASTLEHIEVVSSLPATIDPYTLYLIK